MIIGAEFSYEGFFTTTYYDDTETLVIRHAIYGNTVKRVLKLVELPAFIEYLENNDSFMIDYLYVTPSKRWKSSFIEGLKREARI